MYNRLPCDMTLVFKNTQLCVWLLAVTFQLDVHGIGVSWGDGAPWIGMENKGPCLDQGRGTSDTGKARGFGDLGFGSVPNAAAGALRLLHCWMECEIAHLPRGWSVSHVGSRLTGQCPCTCRSTLNTVQRIPRKPVPEVLWAAVSTWIVTAVRYLDFDWQASITACHKHFCWSNHRVLSGHPCQWCSADQIWDFEIKNRHTIKQRQQTKVTRTHTQTLMQTVSHLHKKLFPAASHTCPPALPLTCPQYREWDGLGKEAGHASVS